MLGGRARDNPFLHPLIHANYGRFSWKTVYLSGDLI